MSITRYCLPGFICCSSVLIFSEICLVSSEFAATFAKMLLVCSVFFLTCATRAETSANKSLSDNWRFWTEWAENKFDHELFFRCFLAISHLYKRIRGYSKKSVSWYRPRRDMRFFAWCSLCVKQHIWEVFRHSKFLTIFAVFHGNSRKKKFLKLLNVE